MYEIHRIVMGNKELIKGTLKIIILRLLSTNDRMHGYEIAKKTKELTDGNIILTEGALYPTLKKLSDMKLISFKYEMFNGRKRKYYSITELGIKIGQNESEYFMKFVQSMLVLFNPDLSKPDS